MGILSKCLIQFKNLFKNKSIVLLIKVSKYDENMNLIKIHNSIADAGRNIGVHKNNIWGVINNLKKTSGGFIWKYLD